MTLRPGDSVRLKAGTRNQVGGVIPRVGKVWTVLGGGFFSFECLMAELVLAGKGGPDRMTRWWTIPISAIEAINGKEI